MLAPLWYFERHIRPRCTIYGSLIWSSHTLSNPGVSYVVPKAPPVSAVKIRGCVDNRHITRSSDRHLRVFRQKDVIYARIPAVVLSSAGSCRLSPNLTKDCPRAELANQMRHSTQSCTHLSRWHRQYVRAVVLRASAMLCPANDATCQTRVTLLATALGMHLSLNVSPALKYAYDAGGGV